MADQTDQFNPYLPQRDPPDFTSASRGAEPVRQTTSDKEVLANTIKGVGSLFTATVDAADNLIKMNIQDEARGEVEEVRDTDLETLLKDPTLPNEVRSSLGRAKDLTTARDQGSIQEIFYWANMDHLSRKLRNRYPGHKDFVDQYISGLVGGTPANQLRDTLRKTIENADKDSPTAKVDELIERNMAEAGLTDIFTQRDLMKRGDANAKFSNDQEILDHYTRDFARIKAEKLQLDLTKERVAARQAQGQEVAREVEETANSEVMMTARQIVEPLINGLVGSTESQVNKALQAMVGRQTEAGSFNFTAEDKKLLREQYFPMIKQQAKTAVQRVLTDKFYDQLPDDKRKGMLDRIDRMIDDVFFATADEKFGILSVEKDRLESMKVDATMRALDDPINKALFGQRAVVGDQGMGQIQLKYGAQINNSIDRRVRAYLHGGSYDQTSQTTLSDRMDEVEKVTTNPAVYRLAVEGISVDLGQIQKLKPEEAQRLIDSTFGEGNYDILDRYTDKLNETENDMSKHQVYGMLANDSIAKAIKAKDAEVPGIWAKYSKWVANAGVKAFQQDFQNLQEINVYRRRLAVEFNPNTFRFDLTKARFEPGETLPSESIIGLASERIREPMVKAQVDRANLLIAGLTSVLKQDGQEVLPRLTNIFRLVGLTPTGVRPYGSKQGPEIDTLLQSMNRALSKVLSVSGAIETATGLAEQARQRAKSDEDFLLTPQLDVESLPEERGF